MLEKIRPASSPTDHLFVGTDRYQYFTVSWDARTKQLKTEQSYVDQADKVLRDSKESDRCHVDPTRQFMALELYDGVINVLPIVHQLKKATGTKREPKPMAGELGTLGDPVSTRIEELVVRSSTFLAADETVIGYPKMAFLWEDNQDNPQLKIRELIYEPGGSGDPGYVELLRVGDFRGELELGSSHLIPLPNPYGGMFVLAERSITYITNDLSGFIKQPLEPDATVWTCWTQVDDQRWLLADDYGHLFFLMVLIDWERVDSWKLDLIGNISIASCLVYLDGGFVFVGSHSGNSQVIRIADGGLDVVQTLANIAPILDLTIMDLGRGTQAGQISEFSSGQARLVTASGAWQDGTLRSVRSGVGMEELGLIGEMSHITEMWALSSTANQEFHDTLIVAFVDETRVLRMSANSEVEEFEQFCGFELSEATILVSNLPNFHVLQVHESGVRLTDPEAGMVVSEWKAPEGRITSASANDNRLAVVAGGTALYIFDTSTELKVLSSRTFFSDEQIASVTMPAGKSSICIVSSWRTATIILFDITTLNQPLSTHSLDDLDAGIPRSVLLAQILPDGAPPTLFVAMADGSIATFTFDISSNVLSNMNQIILGSEPVTFKTLPRGNGLTNVFASCEQPSLIYSAEGRLVYSAVNSDTVSRVCYFNSKAYPEAVAIASTEELKLASIDTERTTQIQSLSVKETVRAITYSPGLNIFGMGTLRRNLEDGIESLTSSFKLADEVTFKELDSYKLPSGEMVECVISTGPSNNEVDGHGDLFIVGTSVLDDTIDDDSLRGRIMVFEVPQQAKLVKLAELDVRGACRCLAMCDGRVVAGLVKSVSYPFVPKGPSSQKAIIARQSSKSQFQVVIYAIERSPPTDTFALRKLATYRTATAPISLSVTSPPILPSTTSVISKGKGKAAASTPPEPSTLAIADLMKSLSIVDYHPSSSAPSDGLPTALPDTLTEVARHYATVWSTACAAVDAHQWLVSDAEGNLTVLRRNIAGVTEEDRRRLEVTSEMRLGDQINCIVPITNLPLSHSSAVLSKDTTATDPSSIVGTSNLPLPTPTITPKAFLATSSGAIYLFGLIHPQLQDLLMRLQSAIAARVLAPGHMPWARYRAARTLVRESEEPFRFVDGELVEWGLDQLTDVGWEEVVDEVKEGVAEDGWRRLGLGTGLGGGNVNAGERLRGLLEGLRRLH